MELVDEGSYPSQTLRSMRGAASGRRGRTGFRNGGESTDRHLFTKLRQRVVRVLCSGRMLRPVTFPSQAPTRKSYRLKMIATRPKSAAQVLKAMTAVHPTAQVMDSKDEPKRPMIECREQTRDQSAHRPARGSR